MVGEVRWLEISTAESSAKPLIAAKADLGIAATPTGATESAHDALKRRHALDRP